MKREPKSAFSGRRVGRICDACNRGVRTGDLVRAYATYYGPDGWLLRRLWCRDCGDERIEVGTAGADEVVLEAIFWKHRLISVEILDQKPPNDEG